MTDTFSLDVDPEGLRAQATKLVTLGDDLSERGETLRTTAAETTEGWTGTHADNTRLEMVALAGHMKGLSAKFRSAAKALRSLATDYAEAQQTIANANTQWTAAQTAYDQAVKKADDSHARGLEGAKGPNGQPPNRAIREEYDQIRSTAMSDASDDRRVDQTNINRTVTLTKQWLAHRTAETGKSLAEAVVIKVKAREVDEFRATGKLPDALDRSSIADLTMGLATRKDEIAAMADGDVAEYRDQAAADIETIQELLGDDPMTVADADGLRAHLEKIGDEAQNPLYSQALVEALGVDGLNELYDSLEWAVHPSAGASGETPDDWSKTLEKFNDAIASGLSRYDDAALHEFVQKLGSGKGTPSRLGLVANSDFSDSRVQLMALSVVDTMSRRAYSSSDQRYDIAQWTLLGSHTTEELAKKWSDLDPVQASNFINGLSDKERERLLFDMGWDGMGDMTNGPVDRDVYAAKMEAMTKVLEAALTVGEADPKTIDAVISKLLEAGDHPMWNEIAKDLVPILSNPDIVTTLATENKNLDMGDLGRLYRALGDDVDFGAMIDDVVASRTAGSKEGVANDVGFLLGLADRAGAEVDYSKVYTAVVDAVISKAIEKVPVGGEVWSILKSFGEAGAEVDEGFDTFSKEWSQESEHTALAWAIYLGEHGEPPGFTDWLEYTYEGDPKDRGATIEAYMAKLKRSDAPDDKTAYEQMLQYAATIDRARK